MTNLIIKNNICNNNAIIKALGRSVIELKNSSFENNEIIFGSGIVSVFLLAKVTISFCYFSENKGNTDGLILYIMNTYFPVVMNVNNIFYYFISFLKGKYY